ncbi:putative ATP-dependent DNA helicase HFM1 [Frankliniella fusca]|uniref:ATP-dependent DNA helicase HFM1 n=1 Tax=Frankliniella fusca TaxID=407009 RepID=A0AAE1GZT1_9NEOP|nr:putative ATP-dependent DNA helicase HFM1 [Frankliniella fusca]
MVQVELNALAKYGLVETNGIDIRDTPAGRLMARYYVAFETMKNFMQVQGEEKLSDLLTLLARAAEFHDVQLRNDEKSALNALNSRKDGKPGLRFPIKGRIKDRECKVNCLLQSLLGGLHIAEPGLQQEAARVARTAERLARCLCEVVQLSGALGALLSAVQLHKCVRCQLWEVSALEARQLPRIGPVLAGLLVAAGKTSLRAVAQSNPRDLERIVNRLPPFGNELRDAAAGVPQLSLSLERVRDGGGEDAVVLRADIVNLDSAHNDRRHWVVLLAGDSDNRVIVFDRFPISKLFQGTYYNRVDVSNCCAETIKAYLISESWVGIDCEESLEINKAAPAACREPATKSSRKRTNFMDKIMQEAASRTDSTPSVRLANNQGLRAGGMTLSQRFERFKKTPNLKRLPSLALEDDDDDPDDPPPLLQSVPRAAEAAAVPAVADEEVIVIEDDFPVDDWDVQVVPGSQRASSSGLEYSAIPHQPTIKNFFKSAPPATVAAKEPAASSDVVDLDDSWGVPTSTLPACVDLDDSWGVPTTTLPASVDLDDSWNDDILHAAREADKSSLRTIRWRPPTPPNGYIELRAGCWDFNFDIGIEDLLRLSDDESKVPEMRSKNKQDSFDFEKWCEQEDLAILGHKTEAISTDRHTMKKSPREPRFSDPLTDKRLPYDKMIPKDAKIESPSLCVDPGKNGKFSDSNSGLGDGWPDSDFTKGNKLLGADYELNGKWTDADLREVDNLSDVNLQQFLKLPNCNMEWRKPDPDEINKNISDLKVELNDGWPAADCGKLKNLSDLDREHDDNWPDAVFEQGDSLPNSTPGLADNLPDMGCGNAGHFTDEDRERSEHRLKVVSQSPASLSCRVDDKVVFSDSEVRQEEPISRAKTVPKVEDPSPYGRTEQRVILPAAGKAAGHAAVITAGHTTGHVARPATGPAVGSASGQATGPAVGPSTGLAARPAVGPSAGPAARPAAGAAPGLAVGPSTGPAVGPSAGPTTGPAAGPATGPAAGPAAGAAPRLATGLVVGPSTGPAMGPPAGPTTGPAAGSATGPAAGPAAGAAPRLATGLVVGPSTGLAVGPSIGPAVGPAAGLTTKTASESSVEPTTEPALSPGHARPTPASTEPSCARTEAPPEEKEDTSGALTGLEGDNLRRDSESTNGEAFPAVSVPDNKPPPSLPTESPSPQKPSRSGDQPLPSTSASIPVYGLESCAIKILNPILAGSNQGASETNIPESSLEPQVDTTSPKLKGPCQARIEADAMKNPQTVSRQTEDQTNINHTDSKMLETCPVVNENRSLLSPHCTLIVTQEKAAEERKVNPPTSGVFKIVASEEKQPGEGQSAEKIAHLGQTFQRVLAANKSTCEPSSLLKFRPQNGGSDTDDVISRLLADWSNGRPSARSTAGALDPRPPPARGARAVTVTPAPSMLGALCGAPARRTPAGVVSVVAAPPPRSLQENAAEKQVDCVERILQEGVPTRLMDKGVVRTLNTDRLRAAGLIRGGGTILSKKLASGLSATLASLAKEDAKKHASAVRPVPGGDPPPSDLEPPPAPAVVGAAAAAAACPGEAGLEECARPAAAVASKASDVVPVPSAASPGVPPRAPSTALGARFSSPASLAKSSSSSSSRTPSILSSFIKIPNRGAGAQASAPRPAGSAGATKLDWFERLLAEPVRGHLRRLPQPKTATAKRKAEESRDPGLVPVEPKRPCSQPGPGPASPWPARLTLPLMETGAQASRPSKYGGFSGSLSVTATRLRSTPPSAPRDQLGNVSLMFPRDDDMPAVSWRRGRSPGRRKDRQRSSRNTAPWARMDDELCIPPPTRGEGDGSPAAPALQDVDDGEAILFARSREQRSPMHSPGYGRVQDGDGDWHGRDDAYTPPPPTSSPPRPWQDVGDDDAELWGDYPSSASLLSPAASCSAEHLFSRRRFDEDDNLEQGRQSPPPSYGFSPTHSPSYSPAPQRQDRQDFNWRPSFSSGWGSRAMENGGDDPYAYVPESTRAARSRSRPCADADPWPQGSPERSPRSSRPPPVPPTPAPAGRLVLSLSPSPVPRRAPAYSKWDSYLD